MKNPHSAVFLLVLCSVLSIPLHADRGAAEHRSHNGYDGNDRYNHGQGFGRQSGRASFAKPVRYYSPGYRVGKLPPKRYHFVHDHRDYYYFGGNFFYHPQGYYQVVRPPYGVRVPYLPPGYVSFFIGPSRYFYANFTYYLWDDAHRDYVVVRAPQGGEEAVLNAADTTASEIYAYPARGQSAEQQDRDYYDCHVWSVEESGFDPTMEGQNIAKSRDYRRALVACLEGRGYSVR